MYAAFKKVHFENRFWIKSSPRTHSHFESRNHVQGLISQFNSRIPSDVDQKVQSKIRSDLVSRSSVLNPFWFKFTKASSIFHSIFHTKSQVSIQYFIRVKKSSSRIHPEFDSRSPARVFIRYFIRVKKSSSKNSSRVDSRSPAQVFIQYFIRVKKSSSRSHPEFDSRSPAQVFIRVKNPSSRIHPDFVPSSSRAHSELRLKKPSSRFIPILIREAQSIS